MGMERPENPQSFVIREECHKACWQHGFRRKLGEADGWAAFGSTTADGVIYLAAARANGPWFLALDHTGVVEELNLNGSDLAGPGIARYSFENLGQLYNALLRVYQLAVSLPNAPLREFHEKTMGLPKSTEAERLVVQRVGQDVFRAGLIEYWQGRCLLTGITDLALLRASHIVPWKDCESDAERLDVHNGLLLSALWDAAFDKGLVSFEDNGSPIFSQKLTDSAKANLQWNMPLPLSPKHRDRMTWHRGHIFIDGLTQ